MECGRFKGHLGTILDVYNDFASIATQMPSPLAPFDFRCSQHGPTTRPSVERTVEPSFRFFRFEFSPT